MNDYEKSYKNQVNFVAPCRVTGARSRQLMAWPDNIRTLPEISTEILLDCTQEVHEETSFLHRLAELLSSKEPTHRKTLVVVSAVINMNLIGIS